MHNNDLFFDTRGVHLDPQSARRVNNTFVLQHYCAMIHAVVNQQCLLHIVTSRRTYMLPRDMAISIANKKYADCLRMRDAIEPAMRHQQS